MRFEEAYQGWTGGRLTQAEAALLLGQCERSFRRHVDRYKEDGLEGLLDKRLSQISKRRAAQAEIDQVVQTYKSGFAGWNVAHFHSKYKGEIKGTRSYSWVKSVLQGAGVVKASRRRGKHRIKRERAPLSGMLAHSAASSASSYRETCAEAGGFTGLAASSRCARPAAGASVTRSPRMNASSPSSTARVGAAGRSS